jgi:hypothetical protein
MRECDVCVRICMCLEEASCPDKNILWLAAISSSQTDRHSHCWHLTAVLSRM